MKRQLLKSEKGFSLVEVLVSVAILGMIAVAFLSGLTTASKVSIITDSRETAKNLAETQMEYVKGQPYAESYVPAAIPAEQPGYTAIINVESLQDSNIQKITVTIRRNNTIVTTLQGYKVG